MKNEDGSWSIKASGGARVGSGRKLTGRKKANFYITDEEKEKVIKFIESIRKQ